MKKLLFITGLILAFTQMKSQGNLQFNQVLNITNGTSYTVPSGKVLKIESINFNNPSLITNYASCYVNCPGCGSSSGVSCSYQGVNYLVIGDNIFSGGGGGIYVGSGGSCSVCPPTKSETLSAQTFNLPIWLGAGKNVSVLASGIFISAIEFNLVP
jgi:hypothetical protein